MRALEWPQGLAPGTGPRGQNGLTPGGDCRVTSGVPGQGGTVAPCHVVFTQLFSRGRGPEGRVYSAQLFPEAQGQLPGPPWAAEDASRNPPLPLPPRPGIVYLSQTEPESPQHRTTRKSGLTDHRATRPAALALQVRLA